MSSSAELNGSILAEASYSDLWDEVKGSVVDVSDVSSAVEAKGFSEKQTDIFMSQWRVASQQPNTSSGFSATLFAGGLGSDLANLLYTRA